MTATDLAKIVQEELMHEGLDAHDLAGSTVAVYMQYGKWGFDYTTISVYVELDHIEVCPPGIGNIFIIPTAHPQAFELIISKLKKLLYDLRKFGIKEVRNAGWWDFSEQVFDPAVQTVWDLPVPI